jgi:hypothetical protein
LLDEFGKRWKIEFSVLNDGSSLLSVGVREAEFSCVKIEHGDEVVG